MKCDAVVRGWWRQRLRPQIDTSAARATRARLRRAADWREAMLEPAAIELAQRLGVLDQEYRLEMALGLAVVLAHVKEDSRFQPLMRAAGYRTTPADPATAEPPLLAPQRFRRLIRSRPEELPRALVRLVHLLGGTANIGELAAVMLDWAAEDSREARRRRWAFDYYAAPHEAPDTDAASSTDTDTTETERTSA